MIDNSHSGVDCIKSILIKNYTSKNLGLDKFTTKRIGILNRMPQGQVEQNLSHVKYLTHMNYEHVANIERIQIRRTSCQALSRQIFDTFLTVYAFTRLIAYCRATFVHTPTMHSDIEVV